MEDYWPVCRNCKKPIERYEKHDGAITWVHKTSGLEACSIWESGKWAEPREKKNRV